MYHLALIFVLKSLTRKQRMKANIPQSYIKIKHSNSQQFRIYFRNSAEYKFTKINTRFSNFVLQTIKMNYCVEQYWWCRRKNKMPDISFNNTETTLREVSKWIEVITVAIILYKSFYCRHKIANHLSSENLAQRTTLNRKIPASIRRNSVSIQSAEIILDRTKSSKGISRVNYFIKLTSHAEIRFISIKFILKTR